MTDIFLYPGEANPNDVKLRDPTTSGTGPQILAALACVITLSAPSATVQASATLSAGQNTITISAPAATVRLGFTLAAGSNTITISAPAASAKAAITRAAGSNTITLSAPVAVRLASTRLQPGTNVVTFSAPAATVLGGTPAGSITPTVTPRELYWGRPISTRQASYGVALVVGSNAVTITAPTATLRGQPWEDTEEALLVTWLRLFR